MFSRYAVPRATYTPDGGRCPENQFIGVNLTYVELIGQMLQPEKVFNAGHVQAQELNSSMVIRVLQNTTTLQNKSRKEKNRMWR